MKFYLELVENPNTERVIVNLISRNPHSFGSIRAILDTGSPTTIISARDAEILNISVNNAEIGEPIRGFGKGSIPSKKLREFVFAMRSENNTIKNIKIPVHVIDIAGLKNMQMEFRETTYQTPTIIGMDFLRLSNMKLFIDLKNHVAFLED